MDFLQDAFYLDFDFVQLIFQQRWIGRQGDATAGAIYVKHTIATWKEMIYLKNVKNWLQTGRSLTCVVLPFKME